MAFIIAVNHKVLKKVDKYNCYVCYMTEPMYDDRELWCGVYIVPGVSIISSSTGTAFQGKSLRS